MAMTEDELDEAKRDLLREIERGDEAGATDTALVLIEEIAQVAAELTEARREVERYREALEHAASVLYRIGNERRTDDAHKINAHVEHIRISRVLHGLHPTQPLGSE